jgi:hypothetical protein
MWGRGQVVNSAHVGGWAGGQCLICGESSLDAYHPLWLVRTGEVVHTYARIYRHSFLENKPKTLVFYD